MIAGDRSEHPVQGAMADLHAQVTHGAGWRDQDILMYSAGACPMVDLFGKFAQELFLCFLMPVRLADGGTLPARRGKPARPVVSLVARRRVTQDSAFCNP